MTDPTAELVEHATELIAAADRVGVPLRITGSLACMHHCPDRHQQHLAMRGEPPHDLDLVAERKTYRTIREMMEAFGYVFDEQVALASDRRQLLFRHKQDELDVDVYLGQLNYCHPISFTGRLECDTPTVPLAELLLAKVQIVELTSKDIADAAMLLLEHDLADADDRDVINLSRITTVLSDDWGFQYTTELSLAKIEHALQASSLCSEEERATVRERIGKLRAAVEAAPKSRRWRLRSRLGTRKRWYEAVEDKTVGADVDASTSGEGH
jgi:hypothetical protein